jgi:hypothetical protein
MFKMGLHDSFGRFKHKLWPKEKNRPNFLVYRLHATYYWKVLDRGYNFASNFISIGGLHTKLCAPQSCKSPNFGNIGTSESHDKMTFGC